jgi:uncharacterized membrane protein YecN with MAPEG domain
MQVPITALYAGLLAIYAIWLSSRAGLMRGKTGVSILYGDNMELAEKVRRHQNFVEYVPLALILIGVLELNGGSPMFLHILGVLLIIARVAHAHGLFHDNISHPLRAVGAGGTALITAVAGIAAIWKSVDALFM